jgi:DnaJ-class molecular chaperone
MDVQSTQCPDCAGSGSYWITPYHDHLPNSEYAAEIRREDEHIDPCDYCHGDGVIDELLENKEYVQPSLW